MKNFQKVRFNRIFYLNISKQKKLSLEEENLIHEQWPIESICHILKLKLSLEHTQHHSLFGFFTHIFTYISSYLFYSKNNYIAALSKFQKCQNLR